MSGSIAPKRLANQRFMHESFCWTPTKTPTKPPTKLPTKTPTKTPTKKPTKTPTKPWTTNHSEVNHINANEQQPTELKSHPMRKCDDSRKGRTDAMRITILAERGEKSAPKSLQMALRDPIRTLRETMSTERGEQIP